jgi:UDP:flavonoid glycosyltransferase YjiC (YdhE family)
MTRLKPIVFLIFPAHGHINPTLPIVRELVKLGRPVVYYNTPGMKEKIIAAGAEFRSYRGINDHR